MAKHCNHGYTLLIAVELNVSVALPLRRLPVLDCYHAAATDSTPGVSVVSSVANPTVLC